MEEIREHIATLSRHEKLALIRDITLLLEEDEMNLGDAQEIARRVALADENPLEGASWPDVRARLEAQTKTVEREKVAA